MNVPVAAISLGIGAWLIPTTRHPEAPKLDLVGFALSIVGIVTVVYTNHRGTGLPTKLPTHADVPPEAAPATARSASGHPAASPPVVGAAYDRRPWTAVRTSRSSQP